MLSFPPKKRYKILLLISILPIFHVCSGQELPCINICKCSEQFRCHFLLAFSQIKFCFCVHLKVFINEKGNNEAIYAMNNVSDYLNNCSSIGVTIYTEFVDGEKTAPKEFLDKCKFMFECFNYCCI